MSDPTRTNSHRTDSWIQQFIGLRIILIFDLSLTARRRTRRKRRRSGALREQSPQSRDHVAHPLDGGSQVVEHELVLDPEHVIAVPPQCPIPAPIAALAPRVV